jgi:hypothetical protein
VRGFTPIVSFPIKVKRKRLFLVFPKLSCSKPRERGMVCITLVGPLAIPLGWLEL